MCRQRHRVHLHIGPDVGVGLKGDERDAMPTGGKPSHQLLVVYMAAGATIHSSR